MTARDKYERDKGCNCLHKYGVLLLKFFDSRVQFMRLYLQVRCLVTHYAVLRYETYSILTFARFHFNMPGWYQRLFHGKEWLMKVSMRCFFFIFTPMFFVYWTIHSERAS